MFQLFGVQDTLYLGHLSLIRCCAALVQERME